MSDRGRQIGSAFWKEFCAQMVTTSSGFHPLSNGQTEKVNQEIETVLLCLTADKHALWANQLLWAVYTHNTLVSSATKLSPLQCPYGYQPPLFPNQEREATCLPALAFVRRCKKTCKSWTALLQTAARYSNTADRRRVLAPTYRAGKKVWLSI